MNPATKNRNSLIKNFLCIHQNLIRKERKKKENVKAVFPESYQLWACELTLNDWMEEHNLMSEWILFHASAPRKANDF